MESKVIKMLLRASLIFISCVFLMGYNSGKISKLFLPRVNVYKVRSEDVKTTINFSGELKAKDAIKVRLPYDIRIDEVYVKNGEQVKKGDRVFSIKDHYLISTIEEERASLELELSRLETDYSILTTGTNTLQFQHIELMIGNIEALSEQLGKFRLLYERDLSYEDDVEELKIQVYKKEIELETYLLDSSETGKRQEAEAINVLGKIRKLKDKIKNLEIKRIFYSEIDENGIYIAESDGIITGIMGRNQYANSNETILNINKISDYASYYYHASFAKEKANLIQKDDIINIKISESSLPIKCRITKVYDVVGDAIDIDAEPIEENEFLVLGLKADAEAVEYASSSVNIPRNSILNRGEIKIGTKVQFYIVSEVEGLLGTEYKCMLSYGTATYIGDDMIGLSEKTLPIFPKIVVINPSSKLKSGEKVSY